MVGCYLTGSGNGQEPRQYLPFPLTDLRRLDYYLWQQGMTLCEFWALDVRWRKKDADPLRMVVGSVTGGGKDSLIYPNLNKDLRQPFLSSLRWEAIRDGIEDYCYLWLLDKLVARSKVGGQTRLAETGGQVLAQVASKFGSDLRAYTLADPREFMAARKVLAETIVKLKGDGPDVALPKRAFKLPGLAEGNPAGR
jgi:hypothetical protein